MNYPRLTTIQDVIRYWRACINRAEDPKSGVSKVDMASNIIGSRGIADHYTDNDPWEDWYHNDKEFCMLFETASDCETHDPNNPRYAEYVRNDWNKITELLPILEKRYHITE